jgi:hypothetical protein
MSFDAEEDHVYRADFFEIAGNFWMRFEITFDASYADAVLLHGAEVRAAGKESDVLPGARHEGADIGADSASACDQKLHAISPGNAAGVAAQFGELR